MKYVFLFISLAVLRNAALAQPVVYFNFLSHNEETPQWNGAPFYTANRARLMQLADYFSARGISWNLQSDWVYLSNVLTKETPALMASTNGKNILRWLHEDRAVEIDPHAHESQYLYPDVVKLMDSVGLPESKVIGGTIYNDSNGRNIWTNLVNGQYGRIYTTRFWKPDYMMGGGTPNHVADLKYFGFWNPTGPSDYLTHNPASPLHHLGVGCEMKIRDTTNVLSFIAGLKDLVQKVQTGGYPSNGIYLQTIFFEQANLNTAAFYNKVTAIADSVNAIVSTGKAQWKTLKQVYTLWETAHAEQAFQWECGKTSSTSVNVTQLHPVLSIYPNPSRDIVRIEMTGMQEADLSIYDAFGRRVHHTVIQAGTTDIDMKRFPPGMYVARAKGSGADMTTVKLMLQ